MINISPHNTNLLRDLNRKHYAIINQKYTKSTSCKGPRAGALDLAFYSKVSTHKLFSLNGQLNKLKERKRKLTLDQNWYTEQRYDLKQSINKVIQIIIFLNSVNISHPRPN